MKHIANIGYLRDSGPEETRWKKIGRLIYDAGSNRLCILLHGWRQGLCIAKPFAHAPFFRGEIVYPIGTKTVDGVETVDHLFVGFIGTNIPDTFEADPHYAIKLEAMPMTSKLESPAGLWLDVLLDDKEGWRPHEEHPR